MKTVGFSCLAILLLVGISPAQVQLGLAAGVNSSTAYQSNFSCTKTTSTTGYAVGGVIDLPVTERWSFLIEPTYLEKGTSTEPINIQGYSPRMSFDLSYLEVPILLKYSVGKELRPYIVFGPSLGFNVTSSVGAEISGPWFGQLEIVAGANDMVRTVECSLEFGGGLSYQLDEILSVFVEGRYSHTLTSALRQGGVTVSVLDLSVTAGGLNNANYKNRGFVFMVGFTLPL
jgi:opacity protein-like surface antigen